MVVSRTPEMLELQKIYKPYEEGCHLVPNAPQEAIEAKKKFIELFKKECEHHLKFL